MTKQTKVEEIDLAQEFFLLPPKYRTMNNLRELYRNAIEQDRKQAREEGRREVVDRFNKIVVDEHYKLEEWLADTSKPKEMPLFDIAQQTMKTRNAITSKAQQIIREALTPKEDKEL